MEQNDNPEDEYTDPDDQTQPQAAGADEMDALMDQYLNRMGDTRSVGQVVNVPIVAIHEGHAMVDVGDKAEGMVDIRDLQDIEGNLVYKVGDFIDAIVKGTDQDTGLVMLSHAEARRRKATEAIQAAIKNNTPIKGKIVRVVKGGLIVDIGTTAFLPASQIDRKRIENFEEWIGREVEGYVIEFVPEKRRIILSRRKVLEEQEGARRTEVLQAINPGETRDGVVKRLVDFGAFVDLGGIDGLIPRSEISWHRMGRPEDYLKVGETVQVKVLGVDPATGKITLSRKQLGEDPWARAAEKYPVGTVLEGEIVSVTNYGAFVRLEEGVDGMIHISDMSWDSTGKQPSAYVSVGSKVQATVIAADPSQRRISLGLKQLTQDPWTILPEKYPRMARIKGKVTGLTKYGAFVELEPGIEGMVHVSDFSWDQRVAHPRDQVNKGDEVEACVLNIDVEQRRISLGIKQLTLSPMTVYAQAHKAGQVVEGEVTSVTEFGAFLKLDEGIEGFIHVSQLDKGRVDAPQQAFQVGQKLEAEIMKIDQAQNRVNLSRRSLLKKEEKITNAKYMDKKKHTSGGVNLGELLSELPLDDELSKS